LRVVLDVNVLIAALLARDGSPARVLLRWLAGDFELIISERLISELTRALSYSKMRLRVSTEDATAFVAVIEANATKATDPAKAPRRSRDPGDDYLLALAAACSAIVVSGDRDLLALKADLPIYSPSEFLAALDR
jgi:putative PIN family toxin of toxin-antitoxin system